MSKETGGPAFPAEEIDDDQSVSQGKIVVKEMHLGMTLRDYFAAKALAVLTEKEKETPNTNMIACWAYQIADAMIAERNK